MDCQHFFEAQKQALYDDFSNGMTTCLMATTADRLVSHARDYGWTIGKLPGIKTTSAVTIQKPNRLPELWVSHTYRNYRRAFAF